MTTTTEPTTMTSRPQPAPLPEVTRGYGWRFFSGTLLGTAGLMRIVDSIWAFRYHGALPVGLQDGLLGDNLKTYGWLWLGIGILLIVSSFLVLVASQFGRWVGVAAGTITAVSAVFWLPYYPVWSLVYIGLAMMMIYGLITYGGREYA